MGDWIHVADVGQIELKTALVALEQAPDFLTEAQVDLVPPWRIRAVALRNIALMLAQIAIAIKNPSASCGVFSEQGMLMV